MNTDRAQSGLDYQGRYPRAVPTKPTLIKRLLKWWTVRAIKSRLASLEVAYSYAAEELSTLRAEKFRANRFYLKTPTLDARLEMAKHDVFEISREIDQCTAQLADAECAA